MLAVFCCFVFMVVVYQIGGLLQGLFSFFLVERGGIEPPSAIASVETNAPLIHSFPRACASLQERRKQLC